MSAPNGGELDLLAKALAALLAAWWRHQVASAQSETGTSDTVVGRAGGGR
jgi:hypothetical protein